jgi:hypothetical protein
VESKDFCLLTPQNTVSVGLDRILEISVDRKLLVNGSQPTLSLAVALWEGGLPISLLPAEGWLEIPLGATHFAWP